MAGPGSFDLKAELKLAKCDSIPEIRESIAIAGLDYSSSCNVLIEKNKTVSVSIQCKHEQLKYLLIKPLKVATAQVPKKADPVWTDVDKLPDQNGLTKSLSYSVDSGKAKCMIGFAQAFYDGLITLLLGSASECSLKLRLEGETYEQVLVQVVTAGVVHSTQSADGKTKESSDEEMDASYKGESSAGGYDPSKD